ncbi:MAG: hypothetical protein QXW80_00495 [Candidatus Micrarchaeia archaeon]
MFGKKKGQATIEYLVLLAVAIIIALVIFAFMGWIPGFAGSLKERQVKLYWSSQYPIQIREYKFFNQSGDGNLTLQVQNVADYQINITGFSTRSASNNTPTYILLPGETKVISYILGSYNTICSKVGDPYELTEVKINYTIIGGIQNMVETGDRPLVGTCQ